MHKTKGKLQTTIRLTVVAIFVTATTLTVCVAVGLQYYFSETLARRAANDLYTATASSVAAQIHGVSEVYSSVINLLADTTELTRTDNDSELLHRFSRVLATHSMLYGIYIGRADGSLVEVINPNKPGLQARHLRARPDEPWLMMNVTGGAENRERLYRYFDTQLEETRSQRAPTQYNASERDWYRSAMAADKAQWSKPYEFAQSGMPGQTLSKKLPDSDAVLGLDITLAALSGFLAELPASQDSEIFLFDSEGVVFASNTFLAGGAVRHPGSRRTAITGALPAKWLQPGSGGHDTGQLNTVTINDIAHVFFVTPVGGNDVNIRLGVLTPLSTVMAPFREQVGLAVSGTAALLLLLLPLSWWFANPIVKPIKQLALENDKIRKLEFTSVERVPSHVRELDELSESMIAMVASIRAHELAQRELMDAVIRLIGQAIDDKSAYTGGHCERVPELALMLVRAANASDAEAFRDFALTSEDEWREFQIAAWLHDCGKITTPEHIVDKGSKLEAVYNRIHEVRTRFEVLSRDAEIKYWQQLSQRPLEKAQLDAALEQEQHQLQEDFAFVASCNVGGEYLDDDSVQRLRETAERTWFRRFDNRLGLSPLETLRFTDPQHVMPVKEKLLADKPEHIIPHDHPVSFAPELGIKMEVPDNLYNLGELYNLSISRGTLTPEDRFKINEHMISTIKMLDGLPFPEELKNVPRYASTHHETMKGSGYPRKLSGHSLSIPERILAIADIFEALTASDRPYKTAKTVSDAIDILYKMVQEEHIDRDCFELFLTSRVYEEYARTYLQPSQIDKVEPSQYLRQSTSV